MAFIFVKNWQLSIFIEKHGSMIFSIYFFLVSFMAQSQPADTLTDIDGNVYKTVRIGNQVWMAENLRTTRYNNGDLIPFVPGYDDWAKTREGAYAIYNDEVDSVPVYGLLYNGYVVRDPRGIAPEGWRVPDNNDWKELFIYFGIDTSSRRPEETLQAEYRLNYGNPTDIAPTSFLLGPPFMARASGGRFYSGAYTGKGWLEFWWSSRPYNEANAWFYGLQYAHKGQQYQEYSGHISQGFGIRLIKE